MTLPVFKPVKYRSADALSTRPLRVVYIRLVCDALSSVSLCCVFARLVCDALLLCEKFAYDHSDRWCQTLKLVRRIIGGVDYKVRDVGSFTAC